MDANVVSEPAVRAGRREFLGLAVLGLPTILVAMDFSVLLLALPRLSADLHASSVQQLWIGDIYGFVVAGFLITMGAVGERVGRRRLLLIGSAAFAAASVLAARSGSPEILIGARALMGIAGATLMPSTMTLIRTMFQEPKQYGMAMGIWVGCFLGGTSLGPVIGGVLLDFFWWGSVFLLGVPVMVLLLIVGPKVLPEYRNSAAGRIDITSALMSLAAILPVIYGLTELVRYGTGVTQILAIAVGAVFGVLFVRRQLKLSNPMLDLNLFRNRTFSSALILLVVSATLAGADFFVYQYMQIVQGLSPLDTGLWLLPVTVTAIISTQVAPVIAQRVRPAYLIAGGLAIEAVGFLMLTQIGGGGNLVLLVTALVVTAIGIGPPVALGAGMGVGAVPVEKAGSAAAMTQTSTDFGLAMGVAVLGLVGTSVYRHQIAAHIGHRISPAETATARETIAGAVSVAQHFTGQIRTDLLTTAHDAFATALDAAAACSALIAIALAVLVVTALRHIPPSGKATAPEVSPTLQVDGDVPPLPAGAAR